MLLLLFLISKQFLVLEINTFQKKVKDHLRSTPGGGEEEALLAQLVRAPNLH